MSNPQFSVTLPDGTPHVLYEPHPAQLAFHQNNTANLLAVGSRGSGKLIHLDTQIPTPNGFTTMRDIRVGDKVIDESGKPCNVIWKSDVEIDPDGSYKLVFSDGSEIICGANHEWWTFNKRERDRLRRRTVAWREKRRETRNDIQSKQPRTELKQLSVEQGSIRKTKDIAKSLVFASKSYKETNHAIRVCDAWQLRDTSLPIDPYVFGCWLGDGSKNGGAVTTADSEIVEGIESAGYACVKVASNEYGWRVQGLTAQLRRLGATRYSFRENRHDVCAACNKDRLLAARMLCYRCYRQPEVRKQFPKLVKGFKTHTGGVLNKKRIPVDYLFSSRNQRLALLQGLMDTDGYCSETGNVEFCNTNEGLARGVYQLAASLGIKPHWKEARATLYGKDCGPKYRVTWTSSIPVFRLTRKLARLPKTVRRTQQFRFIVSANRIPDTPMQCIQVDSASHLYLVTDACIPTHNSLSLRMDAHMRALAVPNSNLIIVRRTFPELQTSHLVHIEREMQLIRGDNNGYHATNHIAHYPNGSRLFFSHVAKAADALNLLSAEFLAAYFDELSTIPWEFFLKLCASVRVTKGRGLVALVRAATNPLGPSAGDILRYFVNKDVDPEEDPDYDPADWDAIRMDMEDNPYIDIDQYKKRFSGMAPHLRRAWLHGEFALENALFDFYPSKEGRAYHVLSELDLEKLLKRATVYRAIDSGWFPDPTICLWIANIQRKNIVFHEKIWYKTTAEDTAKAIKEEDERLGIKRIASAFCDPSMDINTVADIRTVKDVYEDNGVPLECSINNREAYSLAVHNALATEVAEGTPALQFVQPGNCGPAGGCPYLIRTIPQMQFDASKAKPMSMANHKDDHGVVALAYYLLSWAASADNERPQLADTPKWMKPKTKKKYSLGNDNVRRA